MPIEVETKYGLKKWPRALVLLAAVFFLSGCAGLFGTTSPLEDEARREEILRAQSLLEQLKNTNEDLHSFKGVGTAWVRGKASTWSSRLVLAGASPNKLRVEILTVPGRSSASIATDGEWFYAYLRGKDQFHKQHESNFNLAPVLSIPIPVEDLIALLSGKTPIRSHHHITLEPGTSDGEGRVLALRGRWNRVFQKIHLDESTDAPRMLEMFRGSGELKYRVVFEKTGWVEGFRTPVLLALSSAEGASVRIRLDNYSANAPVNPSMFVLTPDK